MRLEVPTTTDGVVPFERIGRVELDGLGSLDVWWLDSYGGGVFVPVKDALAGRGTYGGGRYLVDTVKGADLGGIDGELLHRPQLRLPAVVRVRPGVDVPARAARQHPAGRAPRRRVLPRPLVSC